MDSSQLLTVIAGCAASFSARGCTIIFRRRMGNCSSYHALLQQARRMWEPIDNSQFMQAYVTLLRSCVRLAAQQVGLAIVTLIPVFLIYVAASMAIHDTFHQSAKTAAPALRSHDKPLTDFEWTFLLATSVGSVWAPLLLRDRA